MKKLYVQTYFNIGNESNLISETKVEDFVNWKEYQKDKSKDILLLNFLNNPTFKLVIK